ncbi:MAG: hypothetical protein LAN18_09120, partial [Acidobacteriia bacterium]|nr:hypothetical protein [Terriglobia bacterium]
RALLDVHEECAHRRGTHHGHEKRGRQVIELMRGDHIVVRKAPEKLRLVRAAKKTYFEILRNKLKWGER